MSDLLGFLSHPATREQFDDLSRRTHEQTGELRLLGALLIDAIGCFLGHAVGRANDRAAQQQEAVLWVGGRSPSLLRFDDVCIAVGIDPDTLRSELFRRLELARRGQSFPSVSVARCRSAVERRAAA
jgi:hypothetical protein